MYIMKLNRIRHRIAMVIWLIMNWVKLIYMPIMEIM